MTTLVSYLRITHAPNCDCSVCWSKAAFRHHAVSRSTPCPDCTPRGEPYQVDGRWYCQTASFCAKHTPSKRPPKFWSVVYDSGKPTPFVPVHEPFELEG
ncbi:DUF5447 family protein [Pseudomonas kuykendallii]|uniref:lysogeny maintenance protein PflM n=1 Tax=Pseudomonas kuykendallii TaxID=1007099 RepID=UPI0028D47117|nr:DUF5447 family protein [Pseudomonas kuykendallii]